MNAIESMAMQLTRIKFRSPPRPRPQPYQDAVLDVLVRRGPRHVYAIQAETGLTINSVHSAIQKLKKAEKIEAVGTAWVENDEALIGRSKVTVWAVLS